MPQLFHCIDARSFRALWAMEEMGIAYELRMLPFPPRFLAPEFLAENSLGTVPLFVDGLVRMTESVAVCQYLVERHGPTPLRVDAHEDDFGAYLNWLHQGESTLTFPQTIYLRYARLESAERRNPRVAEDYARWFLARLRGAEEALRGRRYLCADRLTLADISVGFALLLADVIGLAERLPPEVARYWKFLQTIDSFKRARAAEESARLAQGIAATVLPPAGEPARAA